jgi:hypothetical protein
MSDEWGHSLHDLRESHCAHWWPRVIDTGNEYRHMFLYTPSFIERYHITFPGMASLSGNRYKLLESCLPGERVIYISLCPLRPPSLWIT